MAATSGTLQALPASMLARNEIIDLSIAHAELVKENVRLCRWIPDILVVGKATAAIRSRNRAVHGRDATSADTSTALCQSAAMWTGGGADANAAMGWSWCCVGPPALATEPSLARRPDGGHLSCHAPCQHFPERYICCAETGRLTGHLVAGDVFGTSEV